MTEEKKNINEVLLFCPDVDSDTLKAYDFVEFPDIKNGDIIRTNDNKNFFYMNGKAIPEIFFTYPKYNIKSFFPSIPPEITIESFHPMHYKNVLPLYKNVWIHPNKHKFSNKYVFLTSVNEITCMKVYDSTYNYIFLLYLGNSLSLEKEDYKKLLIEKFEQFKNSNTLTVGFNNSDFLPNAYRYPNCTTLNNTIVVDLEYEKSMDTYMLESHVNLPARKHKYKTLTLQAVMLNMSTFEKLSCEMQDMITEMFTDKRYTFLQCNM
jgi:hypothetical protein